MNNATLEHLNITVRDPRKTAQLLCKLFDWSIRWEGDSIHGGRSVHVGGQNSYLALYTDGSPKPAADAQTSYHTINGLNHLGIVVQDLTTAEQRVIAAGYQPHSHANYSPGNRFYFNEDDGLEIEIISYT